MAFGGIHYDSDRRERKTWDSRDDRNKDDWDEDFEEESWSPERAAERKKRAEGKITAEDKKNIEAIKAEFKNYEFVKKLGSGGYGSVYEFSVPRRQNQAVKTILSNSHAMDEKVEKECRNQENLGDDITGIVPLKDYAVVKRDDGRTLHMMAMQLMDGSVKNLLEQNIVINNDEAVRIAVTVCTALDRMYKMKKMIHGDIKPANIMYICNENGSRNYKLGDFGIAYDEEDGTHSSYYATSKYIFGEDWTTSRDTYALGITLMEILGVEVPSFDDKASHEILWEDLPEETVPEGILKICQKACSRSQENRYHNPGEMLRALEKWQAEQKAALAETEEKSARLSELIAEAESEENADTLGQMIQEAGEIIDFLKSASGSQNLPDLSELIEKVTSLKAKQEIIKKYESALNLLPDDFADALRKLVPDNEDAVKLLSRNSDDLLKLFTENGDDLLKLLSKSGLDLLKLSPDNIANALAAIGVLAGIADYGNSAFLILQIAGVVLSAFKSMQSSLANSSRKNESVLADRDSRILGLKTDVTERDNLIKSLQDENDSLRAEIRERDISIENLNQKINESDRQIRTLNASMAAMEKRISAADEYVPGSLQKFGHFPKGFVVNGNSDMSWRVLARKEDRVLLVMDEALGNKSYHDKQTPVTWSDCKMNEWLNNSFYRTAFSEEEQKRILETTIETGDNDGYGVSGGKSCPGKVFVLSCEELKEYMPEESRRCRLLQVNNSIRGSRSSSRAAQSYEDENPYCKWWLRTPGNSGFFACFVDEYGKVMTYGREATSSDIAVRPAIWVKI